MTREEVEEFRKMAAQLDALHQEALSASKKSPDKPVSTFKVDLANTVIEQAKRVLGASSPALNFTAFDKDDLPTNSDLSFIVTQFVECAEKVRSENIQRYHNGVWYWLVSGLATTIATPAPKGVR